MTIVLDGRRVAVLGYHKIAPPPEHWWSWYYVPEGLFAEQLGSLLVDGWQPIDLAGLLAGLDDPARLPARAVLVTFDDGYRSFLDSALDVLVRYGCPGVLFVPTAFVGGRNEWDAGLEPEEAICSWDELRQLAGAGVAVQSHAHRHRTFSELSRVERAVELRTSRARIETNLGPQVHAVAYPYGDAGETSPEMDAVLRAEGYRAGFLFGGEAAVDERVDRFRLPRIAVGSETDLRQLLSQVRRPAP